MMEEILSPGQRVNVLLCLQSYKTSQRFIVVERPELKYQKPESWLWITEGITGLAFIVTLHTANNL